MSRVFGNLFMAAPLSAAAPGALAGEAKPGLLDPTVKTLIW